MRRSIAEHMVRSRQTSPDAWGLVEVDVSGLVKAREALLADWQRREGFELTYLPFFVKAVVESLREHPLLNSSWGEDKIVVKKRINVGIAVAVQDGLIVPVIADADQRSVAGLAHAVRDLATRARANKLSPNDVQGGTFTVNNTGALGSIMSQPIINQPQAAIITMEAIVKRPVVLEHDAIAIRSMMNVCLSFDHRILDGGAALRFLQSVKRRLEAYGPGVEIY
jgi:2-oxoisovalerate dehydrogenase E2 component (dihydrolipoyl transacylase)